MHRTKCDWFVSVCESLVLEVKFLLPIASVATSPFAIGLSIANNYRMRVCLCSTLTNCFSFCNRIKVAVKFSCKLCLIDVLFGVGEKQKFLKMGTVVGTCMPEIEHQQTTFGETTTLAPIRRRRYGKLN